MIIQIKNLLNNYSIKVKEGKAIKITNLVMKSQHKKAKVETTKNTKGKIKRMLVKSKASEVCNSYFSPTPSY